VKHLEKAAEQLAGHLAGGGLRLTRPRRAVLEAVMALDRHFEPAEIEKRAAAAGVHRASVYRILPVLEAAGIVRRVRDHPGRWHYEHVVGHQHHDHLVCERCGGVTEFASPAIESEQARQCRLHGFTETSHHFVIRGVCRQCRAGAAGRKEKTRGRR